VPRSHPEGREWAVERIAATTAPVIIDIGCGEGTYSDLARGWRADAFWVGVEIWEPYVGQFDLWRKYDVVAVRDARELILPAMPYVLLAGDVLEHMTRTDAVELLTNAKAAAAAIMVSVPILGYEQHAHEGGNPYEEHLDQWTLEEMREQLPDCEVWSGEILGRLWWTAPPAPEPEPVDDEQ
jgi:hypothetical protein